MKIVSLLAVLASLSSAYAAEAPAPACFHLDRKVEYRDASQPEIDASYRMWSDPNDPGIIFDHTLTVRKGKHSGSEIFLFWTPWSYGAQIAEGISMEDCRIYGGKALGCSFAFERNPKKPWHPDNWFNVWGTFRHQMITAGGKPFLHKSQIDDKIFRITIKLTPMRSCNSPSPKQYI